MKKKVFAGLPGIKHSERRKGTVLPVGGAVLLWWGMVCGDWGGVEMI